MDNSSLIYGKDDTKNIVSIEQQDGIVEIFREINGEITSEFKTSKRWILSSRALSDGWVRLKGDLHYKYGKQYETEEEWSKDKKKFYGKDIYIINDPKECSMVNKGFTYYKDQKIEDVSILSFDLETTGLDPKLGDAQILLISTTFRRLGQIQRKLFAYDDYASQGEMIEEFCNYVRFNNPSVVCGHNIFGFDFYYLRILAEKHNVDLKLGRDGSVAKFDTWESKFRKEAEQFIYYNRCRIYGREIIDTQFLAIKYDVAARKYASYGLKNIINQEGLEKQTRTFYDASKIRFNYMVPMEWEKIKAYCNDDADDSLALYDLMIKPFFFLARSIPKSFQSLLESASGSQLNSMMVRSYLQEGHSIPKASESIGFIGAISLGNPGIYSNVFKVDVASLYPSIMLEYDVHDKTKDPKGNMTEILKTFTEERLKNKKLAKETGLEYYDSLQNAQKIVINSLYGFLGAQGLNFNYPEGAAFVTRTGRQILEKAIEWATGSKIEEVNNGSRN